MKTTVKLSTLMLTALLISGCAAIQVTETESQCTLTGALFTGPQQEAQEVDSQYEFHYVGDNCTVKVWSK